MVMADGSDGCGRHVWRARLQASACAVAVAVLRKALRGLGGVMENGDWGGGVRT